jgi:hypothetical protein
MEPSGFIRVCPFSRHKHMANQTVIIGSILSTQQQQQRQLLVYKYHPHLTYLPTSHSLLVATTTMLVMLPTPTP